MNTRHLFDNSHRLSVMTMRRCLLELIEFLVLRHRRLLINMVHLELFQ